MTLLLKQIFGLLKLLNSETGTNQIAIGVAAGFVLGMTPAFSLQTLFIFIFILFFRVQIGAAFIAAFFFAFIAYLLDPVFHQVGLALLNMPSLQGLYTSLYNMPIIPYTRFNNSIVMGSGVVAIALMPFVYIVSRLLISKYRVTVVARFRGSKFWRALQTTSLYKWYYSYNNMFGN